MFGPIEEISIEEIKEQFETNFFWNNQTYKGNSSHYEETTKWNYCKY